MPKNIRKQEKSTGPKICEAMFNLPDDPLTPEQIEYIKARINLKPLYEFIAAKARAKLSSDDPQGGKDEGTL